VQRFGCARTDERIRVTAGQYKLPYHNSTRLYKNVPVDKAQTTGGERKTRKEKGTIEVVRLKMEVDQVFKNFVLAGYEGEIVCTFWYTFW
jgi:hypothetical protein